MTAVHKEPSEPLWRASPDERPVVAIIMNDCADRALPGAPCTGGSSATPACRPPACIRTTWRRPGVRCRSQRRGNQARSTSAHGTAQRHRNRPPPLALLRDLEEGRGRSSGGSRKAARRRWSSAGTTTPRRLLDHRVVQKRTGSPASWWPIATSVATRRRGRRRLWSLPGGVSRWSVPSPACSRADRWGGRSLSDTAQDPIASSIACMSRTTR